MTSGTNLIYGGNKKQRQSRVGELALALSPKFANLVPHPDLHIIKQADKKTIGIELVRKAQEFLQTKPFSEKYKLVVVLEAEKLTIQAQNALLKTLEEPPTYVSVILECPTEESLLPTVISRCKKQAITADDETPENSKKINSALQEMLAPTGNLGDRLGLSEKLSKLEREEIQTLLEMYVREQRKLLLANSQDAETIKCLGQNIETTLKVLKDLQDTNIGLRISLDHLLLELA